MNAQPYGQPWDVSINKFVTGVFTAAAVGAALIVMPSTRVSAAELVMFEAALCEWCEAWHEEIGPIYPKTAEARVAPLRRVDIDAPRPVDLAQVAPVVFTPTFVLLDDGAEVGRILGYPGEEFFWSLLGELIRKLEPAPTQTPSD